ncbi:MAG: hypothetical protein P0S94_01905 [Simkaniaceae bacterium]|nr:hypothetical protein [Simkaniaceae bacterium]
MDLFDEMIAQQQGKLLKLAQEIVPHVTPDDLMQPNDFPALEAHPLFRYEEGILEGLYAARTAFVCASKCDGASTAL